MRVPARFARHFGLRTQTNSGFVRKRLCSIFTAGLCLFAFAHPRAWAQAAPTATRAGDLQIGVGYSNANANYEYVHNRITGLYAYGDFEFREHFGVSASFHQLDDPNSAVYQRSYELGGRYVRHYGFGRIVFNPYVKLQGGRGVLNFPKYANLAYNMVAGAGGLDFSVHPRINVRAEYEYQDWLNAPGAGLNITPSMFSVGVAYHFGAGKPGELRR